MTSTALAFYLLATPAKAVDAPTLEYYQDHFVVRQSGEAWRAPAHPPAPRPVLAVAFRRSDRYAVWDERGLTIRKGKRTRSSFLPDLPMSPRAFSPPEITRTIAALKSGERRREAAGLSGALRIGPYAYFLVRWEDRGKNAWAEALMRVDLTNDDLWPRLVGRYEGRSVAFRPIDDRLFPLEGKLACVTRTASTWGVSTYDPKTEKFAFRPFGGKLRSLLPAAKGDVLFVESTPYGTTVGGVADLSSGVRRARFEARGNARFVDALSPLLMVASRAPDSRVRNAESGTELPIPLGAGVCRAGPYAIVFTPYDKPTRATLYDTARWTSLATWRPGQ